VLADEAGGDAGTAAAWPAEHAHGLWLADQVAGGVGIGPTGTIATAAFRSAPGRLPGHPRASRAIVGCGGYCGSGAGDGAGFLAYASAQERQAVGACRDPACCPEMTARAMPGVSVRESPRAGCVVIALRGELDLCTAADGLRPLTLLAATGVRIIVDLAELAFMDCYSLNEFMAVQAEARRTGGDLVLAAPHPAVLRLLVLCDVVSRGLVFTSVDEAVSRAGSALAAPLRRGRRLSLPRRPCPGSCHRRSAAL
jgi:anti-anti-sigma factor